MKATFVLILSLIAMSQCQMKRMFGRNKRNNGPKSYKKSPTTEYARYSPTNTGSYSVSTYPSQQTQNKPQYSSTYSSLSNTYPSSSNTYQYSSSTSNQISAYPSSIQSPIISQTSPVSSYESYNHNDNDVSGSQNKISGSGSFVRGHQNCVKCMDIDVSQLC